MSQEKFRAIAINRKASHNYTFIEKLEVGVVLRGHEVKSIRQGKVQLKDAFARIINNELWLFNCHISPYTQTHTIISQDPVRDRKLLLHAKQLKKWIGKVQEKGLTLIPTKMYFSNQHIKVEIALGQAKKLHDKRASIKEKSIKRDLQKGLKNRY